MNRPELFIFAGINGAGKSTFTRDMSIDDHLVIINPDVITTELLGRSQNLPEGTNVKAGRIALERRQEYIQSHKSFGFESTLSSQQDFKTINNAIENGFNITLIYVGLNSVDLAKERVSNRVQHGGHDIPKEAIERRYQKSLDNLMKILPMVHNAKIYDNSGSEYKLLLEIQNKKIIHTHPNINEWAKNAVEMAKHSMNIKKVFTDTLKTITTNKPKSHTETIKTTTKIKM